MLTLVHDPAVWQAHLAIAPRPALEHSWAFAAAVNRCYPATRPVRWLVEDAGQPVGLLQILTRCGMGQVLRGPVWLDHPTPEQQADRLRWMCRQLPWLRRQLLVIHPELPHDDATTARLRAAGFRRIGGGYRTAWLDLGRDIEVLRQNLRPTWRHDLMRAEATAAPPAHVTDIARIRLFLAHYEATRRTRRIVGPGRRLLHQMSLTFDRADFMLLLAFDGKTPCAGTLFLCHGRAATYYVAWRDPAAAPDVSSHKHLLWEGITALKARGVCWLDLGGAAAGRTGHLSVQTGGWRRGCGAGGDLLVNHRPSPNQNT